MGIFYLKSKTCNCKGQWCTLTNEHRAYLTIPCTTHSLNVGNSIYYCLDYFLNHISRGKLYKNKYLVKILEKQTLSRDKTLIKIEVTGETFDVNNFIPSKQIYYSQMNDEPMWKQIDNNTMHFILVYQPECHTVEIGWNDE
jgi:hypothetical protein